VAWKARTGPRQTQTCINTPATARLRRGRRCPHGKVPVTTWSNLLRRCHGIDLFFSHFPISSLLDPSRRRKSVLHVRVDGLPILRWSKSSKQSLLVFVSVRTIKRHHHHFLPHPLSSLKPPLFDASVPSFVDCSQFDCVDTTHVPSSALPMLPVLPAV
jgi:hypothetical protein